MLSVDCLKTSDIYGQVKIVTFGSCNLAGSEVIHGPIDGF
jgi:hypothetical protein